ncbi:MAG: hypothetical protein V2J24_20605 [Pseudomonadales bacterium]|nr:hypothetical protein [Pseudomonadales bacterium]
MNKLQEISAGLILLFGGEGPAAQRAGDALLADRIEKAVARGGFASIDYDGWRKSADSASRLEFDAIRLARGPGTVDVAAAEMEVFSQALLFRDGEFAWTDDPRRWRFDRVEIERGGLFSRSLRISATGLDPEPGGAAAPCEERDGPRCALGAVGSEGVEHFHMLFRSRDREAVVTIAWQSAGSCWLAWTPTGRGSEDLATWGREYLRAPSETPFSFARTRCDLPAGDAVADGLTERLETVEGAVEVAGSDVVAAAPVLVRTLFGLVAESYAYLLE